MLTGEDSATHGYLALSLNIPRDSMHRAYEATYKNVRIVLRRQLINKYKQERGIYPSQPVCNFISEEEFIIAIKGLSLDIALVTLARVFDAAHIKLCQTINDGKNGKLHNYYFKRDPVIDLKNLGLQMKQDPKVIDGEIVLKDHPVKLHILQAEWHSLPSLSFDHLPRCQSLSVRLPGEESSGHEYAGIGGGGGSDVISASLLGHLLRRHGKEMNLLISTRSSITGSQGKKGSKLGVSREIYNHDGPAINNGKPVPGTFLVKAETYTEGRDLETIPMEHHEKIYIVLDQSGKFSENPEEENVNLAGQFQAIISQQHIDTIIVVDTGGDVFGTGAKGHSTPDQDLRVQQAVSKLSGEYNVITAVLAAGVDAPEDAPEKAFKAGGVVYKPTEEEKSMLLDLIAREYRMDGSDPNRYGKTTLALQARLGGHTGWTSLNLPEHVIDTWENPWSSFVYIRECMSDIILMPLKKLLPLIDQPS